MDEDEYQIQRAFPVRDLLNSKVKIKPGEAPADAMEYLSFVAHEASQCKEVVVAVIDQKKLGKQTVTYLSEEETKAEIDSPNQPTREWKICQVSDFSDVRTQLAKMKAGHSVDSKKVERKSLPLKCHESSWCKYCLGSNVARSLPDFKDSCVEECEANLPTASVICSMDQPLIEKLLEYQIGWMEICGFSAIQGLWIYSLMAGLELPLTPDVCSLLRALARRCASSKNLTESCRTTLNLIICLVSKYFRQLDLEDL
ncbi:gem-associated protein 2 isoform X2 [Neocloeon triangulifer]|uniref:gem-associated protein 2 isoform X2 n=1 Tax=Neocloeon triangulifer TaxID=2078957 RepID=UPI00286FABE3|nr:gem-associated protein 2 isoform X2 [Neocloeon triangulifer]